MKVSELIEELKKVDQDKYVLPYLKALSHGAIKTLSFEDGGRAYRLIEKYLGKPRFNYNHVQGHWLNCRSVRWDAPEVKLIEVTEELERSGISTEYFMVTGTTSLIIHIPFRAWTTSYVGDDPTVWRQKQERKEQLKEARDKKKEELEKALDAKRDAEAKEWKAKWDAEAPQRAEVALKKAQEEAETKRLIALGQQFHEVQEKVKQIKIDDVNVERAVKAHEGD